ncbi:MAG: hypothetical protein ABI740_02015 [Alphaproteobacteria bacterium]
MRTHPISTRATLILAAIVLLAPPLVQMVSHVAPHQQPTIARRL